MGRSICVVLLGDVITAAQTPRLTAKACFVRWIFFSCVRGRDLWLVLAHPTGVCQKRVKAGYSRARPTY